MDRRWGGLMLLILVGFVAVTLPNLAGRRVVGSPVATIVASAPAVGACVIAISPIPPTDQATSDDARVTYPTAVYGSCAGLVLGEVMSVDPGHRSVTPTTVASYDRVGADCRLDEVNYVGSIGPFDPATIATPGIAWQASAYVDSVAVGPTAYQRAAGQTWTACIGATADRTSYRGRIQDALSSGVLPPTYAVCWKSLPVSTDQQVDDQLTSCAAPHPIEILATTQIIDPTTSTTQVSSSCFGLASRALRTSDPTRGGTVRINAYSLDGDSVLPLTSSALLAGYVGCIASVAPPHRLVGTLIGLGDRPAPVVG